MMWIAGSILLGALIVAAAVVLWGEDLILALNRTYEVLDTIGEAIAEAAREDDLLRIPDDILTILKARAGRTFSENIPADKLDVYQAGLKDGETMTAQYVLGELKEETE